MILIIISDFIVVEYVLHYRNVQNVMRFLLKHEFFRDNLIYAFIQIKITDNVRVYIEMHTKD